MCKIKILEATQENHSVRKMIKIENGNYVNVSSIFAIKPFGDVIKKGIENEISAIK